MLRCESNIILQRGYSQTTLKICGPFLWRRVLSFNLSTLTTKLLTQFLLRISSLYLWITPQVNLNKRVKEKLKYSPNNTWKVSPRLAHFWWSKKKVTLLWWDFANLLSHHKTYAIPTPYTTKSYMLNSILIIVCLIPRF